MSLHARTRSVFGRAACAAAAFTITGLPAAGAQAPRLGTITFPTSARGAAQDHFTRGVLWLHSFEYARALQEFRLARQAQPGFAMAAWGDAMTWTHPVWNEQNADSGRAALARLAPTREARRALAPTPREQGYLDAVEALYADSGSKARRDTLYADAMARLSAAFPDDPEASLFHALALLGLNQGIRSTATYMRAAAIADEVFRANPDHPGAAHYLIHSFDDPIHAPLGLRAARAYSKIAPDAAHAQHMTTHIFLALGMWDDVVSQNEIAVRLTALTPGHYTLWLAYGYLQQGRYREARRLIDTLALTGAARPRAMAMLGLFRAQQLANTGTWSSAPAVDSGGAAGRTPADALAQFVRGYSALARGDHAAARRAIDALTPPPQADSARAGFTEDGEGNKAPILARELRGALAISEARRDEAVALLRDAARMEDALPLEFGPPDIVKPTHELLGEVLMVMGQAPEAQREFERALALAPGRSRSLLGLMRAARAAGDTTAARRSAQALLANWHAADADLPELPEVRRQATGVR